MLVLGLSLSALSAAIAQVHCIDAAREAARLTAQGDPDRGIAAATEIAPKNAEININMTGEHIEVEVHATPPNTLLPGLHLHAKAVAIREPNGPSG
ncbi:hypothetical protein CLV71_12257 [Actinophytocola oryzae]|uniref:TadE-like protein n=2 Tax=Actinophytocola oryzae TaxID=502181 RepID=A0A4R7UVB2_9PSEU|nr:hypothetical protein CLV71_12257 [Actinophytocola oryzae]